VERALYLLPPKLDFLIQLLHDLLLKFLVDDVMNGRIVLQFPVLTDSLGAGSITLDKNMKLIYFIYFKLPFNYLILHGPAVCRIMGVFTADVAGLVLADVIGIALCYVGR